MVLLLMPKNFTSYRPLYLQLMTHVRNIDRKMKGQTEESFQKTIMDESNNLKNLWSKNSWLYSTCILFNCLYYKKDG